MKQQATILSYPITPEQAAARWMARIHAADCTAEERAELEQWLEKSPCNRKAFQEFERVWGIPTHLAEHAEVFANLTARADAADRPRKHPRWTRALAAGIATLAIALGWMQFRQSEQIIRMASTSPAPQNLTLPDGSSVTLGGKTSVTASYSANERQVLMRGGEAFFDVSKDPQRPFIVRAGKSEIRVLGTQFNVRQTSDELEVVVRTGKVDVVPDSTVPQREIRHVELASGSRLRVTASAQQLAVAQIDAERFTAWRTGMMKFDAVPLDEVIETLNRHTDRPLVIANESIRHLAISGRFRVGDTEGVRFLLNERFGVSTVAEGERILLR